MSARARPSVAAAPLLALSLAGCATGGFVRPVGPASPFAGADAIWGVLTQGCRDVSSYRAQLRVSGRLRGERVPGLTAGMAVDADRMAMNLRWSAAPEFNIAGSTADVTLLMQRAGRVVRGPSAEVTDALIGVGLTPAGLLAILTGCVTPDTTVVGAERVGATLQVTLPGGLVYLRERGASWQLLAGEIDGMVVDYRRVEDGWPREVVIRRQPDVTLTLRVVEFERNPPLAPGLFQLGTPATFVEMPLETLRAEGPFGPRRD